MTDPTKSTRVDALRRQLAEYIASEGDMHSYTPEEITIATTQLLAGISVSLPGDTVNNIRWVIENYTLAVSQMSSQIGCSATILESIEGGQA